MANIPGKLFACGDINCPGDLPVTVDGRVGEVLQDRGLHQCVTSPTRLGNLLDVVITDPTLRIVGQVSTSDIDFSDHRLVKFDITAPIAHAAHTTFAYRDLKRVDLKVFEANLRQTALFTNPPEPVDDYVGLMDLEVCKLLNTLAPIKSKTKRVPSRPTAVWMTPAAKGAKRLRRRLERRYRRTKDVADYIAYQKSCRAAVRTVNEARAGHFKARITEAKGNPKEMWRTAKELLHTNPTPGAVNPADSESLARSFTTFFSDKLATITLTIKQSLAPSRFPPTSSTTLTSPNQSLHFFQPVTHCEALRLIHSHHTAKSSPVDIIPSHFLKSCPDLFASCLMETANRSFRQGIFPTSFKTAQITPLLKKPTLDANLPSSFRPISNLTTFSKLIERLVQTRLQPHITSSPNFPPNQSAYRPLHSTETAMVRIVNDLLAGSGSGTPTLLVTLDLTSAFDTVDHTKLVERLHCDFGVAGPALDWLASYLADRHQFVKVGSFSARITACSCGVPQGSVLGPLLFVAYISPVSTLIKSFGVRDHAYADDITLYAPVGSDYLATRTNLLLCADAVSDWFMRNDLLVNASKSEVILFGTSSQREKLPANESYTVAGASVSLSDKVKIVGVTLDNRLSMDSFVSATCSSCSLQIKALRHIRPLLDRSTANALACSAIISRLDYCNAVLAGSTAHSISRLQQIQNRAAKTVCQSSRRDSSSKALVQLHWLPVQQRIEFKTVLLAYKALSTGSPAYIRDLLTVYVPTRTLRSSGANLLATPTPRTVLASRAFVFSAPKLWNSLPDDLRAFISHITMDSVSASVSVLQSSINLFKSRLKTFLFMSAYAG